MIAYLYNKYGFTILFWISVSILVITFIINWLRGATGKYQNHTEMIRNLFAIPFKQQTKRQQLATEKPDSIGETECRRVAEKLTGYKFPKKRPDFLRNDITNSNLEIDCYCEELQIGIEYNGRQHYEYTPYFHSSKDAFYNTKYRDEMKARLCKENNVNLIIVPYTIPVDKIESHLRNLLF
jgi:hypothetical protein